MKLCAVALLLMTGCAHKKPVVANQPGVHRYKDCKEVSINYTAQEITVVCPLNPEVKK